MRLVWAVYASFWVTSMIFGVGALLLSLLGWLGDLIPPGQEDYAGVVKSFLGFWLLLTIGHYLAGRVAADRHGP